MPVGGFRIPKVAGGVSDGTSRVVASAPDLAQCHTVESAGKSDESKTAVISGRTRIGRADLVLNPIDRGDSFASLTPEGEMPS